MTLTMFAGIPDNKKKGRRWRRRLGSLTPRGQGTAVGYRLSAYRYPLGRCGAFGTSIKMLPKVFLSGLVN